MESITLTEERIYELLDAVCDPEIPVLSVLDLGIVRGVSLDTPDGIPEVRITPTYTGCPAMDMIGVNIKAVLQEAGISPVRVKLVLHPAWTTDWLTDRGRQRLQEYGIAAPREQTVDKHALFTDGDLTVPCPRCSSEDTELLAEFGSTACKAMYRCKTCLEPFDYFKCHR
ncbi:MAG: 1,2-phenylacetyl-CoA epoxidase subunit PaaD [Saprospiraceae bacterium]